MVMRRRDPRSPTHRLHTQYSSTTGPTASKVTSTGSVTRRQHAQRRGRAINKDRELEGERDVGGEGFDDLIHRGLSISRMVRQLSDSNKTPHIQNCRTSTKCEPSVHREGRTTHDVIVTPPVVTCGNTAPDDYVRDFLSSLRPNLEPKIQEFKRIGLDSKTTLDAFIRWQASEREGWIYSQNLYLQLTPLELSGLMLGIEKLSDGGNGG
ncbi:hypothetical protein EV702DRAFT_92500 [Suillus placidus]|uniref:Uncharacterized protein n=1 Tax=Suillus placidus TaxID=48579 RepID=A0A9P6ZG59_9AGAM|nr:hypothetical protein EV702DRAFT_92500 [Suillus placidus]